MHCAVHTPWPLQKLRLEQSQPGMLVGPQAPLRHTWLVGQVMALGQSHPPWPSQVHAGCSVVSPVQTAAWQVVPLAYRAQAPPLHVPVVPQVAAP